MAEVSLHRISCICVCVCVCGLLMAFWTCLKNAIINHKCTGPTRPQVLHAAAAPHGHDVRVGGAGWGGTWNDVRHGTFTRAVWIAVGVQAVKALIASSRYLASEEIFPPPQPQERPRSSTLNSRTSVNAPAAA